MIKINNLSINYGGPDIVKSISFEIKRNVSIIGPNGCGKTTLLKAMAGLLPYNGSILLEGNELKHIKRHILSKKIAMLTQMSPIYFSYTVYNTVMMGRYLHSKHTLLNIPSKQDNEIVCNAIKAVDLWNEKDNDITKLSGGQLQRVFLARTLAQDPDIILLDEPTNHLDLKYQIELIEYLKNWAYKNNRIIIGVIHDINQAISLCHDIIVMDKGEIKAIGEVNNTINDRLLYDVYGIDIGEYMRKSLKRW